MLSSKRFFGVGVGGLCTCTLLLSVAGGLASAQDGPANSPSPAAQLAEKKANDWSVLAASLEEQVARMLPCDPRVRSDIEGVSRASDARFDALIAYWQEIAQRLSEQVEKGRALIAVAHSHSVDFQDDRTDSEQEVTRLGVKAADLQESVRRQAALPPAAHVLNGISQSALTLQKQAIEREEEYSKLDTDLNELNRAMEARRDAIEDEKKAIAAERSRWSAYYSSRVVRSQMECSITGPPSGARTSTKGSR